MPDRFRQSVFAGVLLVGSICTATAVAQPAAESSPALSPAEPARADSEQLPSLEPAAAADVADAPKPEQATGVKVAESRAPHAWLWVPRALFFVPRWTLWAVAQPIRGTLWAYERYALKDRVKGIFFNDDETLGAYPLAFFETGFGLNYGARLIARDIIADDSELRLRASYGGRFRQLYSITGETGQLLDPVNLEAELSYQLYPRSRFFGLGNANLMDGAEIAMTAPVDPRARETAVRTRYHHDDVTLQLATALELTDDLDVRLTGRYINRVFDPNAKLAPDDFDIFAIYQTSRLVGYDDGLSNLSGEVELVYDTRRGTEFWVPQVNPNRGWKIAGFVGYTEGLSDDPSDYLRYGLDLQRVLDIYDGTRTLLLRAYAEGVTGKTADVPFIDLPKLGGPFFLRGYPRDRFRDRVSAVSTVEYRWMVNKFLAGYIFVDAGRVYRNWSAFDLDGLRVGYGGGIQAHTDTTMRGRFDVSSSRDGDIFFNLSFDPVYDTSSRRETP